MLSRRACLVLFLAAFGSSAAHAGVWLHYNFDADFTDSSSNGNNGVLFDTNTLGNAYITNTAAAFGAGGFTKGDDLDRVDLTTPFAPSPDAPWTISFWATLSGGAVSVGFSSTNTDNYIAMRADVFNGVYLDIGNHGELFFPIVLGQNSFHHYAIVAHGKGIDLDGVSGDDNIVLYVDGAAIAPSNGLDTTTYPSDILVDSFGYGNAWPYGGHGRSDELWIFDQALASNRIAGLYAKNSPSLILYVDDNATGADDGSTWDDAFANLQDGLAAAIAGDQLWVAAGRYYPDEGGGATNDDRASTFRLISDVSLYGGFAGTETNVNQRNIAANLTVLSGDLDKNDATNAAGIVTNNPYSNTIGNNSYHVVTGGGVDSNTVLDGFIITSGRADGDSDLNGGGVWVDTGAPTLLNCSLIGNEAGYNGGGMCGNACLSLLSNCVLMANNGGRGGGASWNNGSDVRFVNGDVLNNTCGNDCAGLFIQDSRLRVDHAVISGNYADNGGGVFQQGNSTMTLVNCLIAGNRADSDAGAALFKNGVATLVNCTLSGNRATTYGAIRNESDNTSYVYNCIIWSNIQDSATNAADSISSDGTSGAQVGNSIVQRSGGSGGGWDASIGVDLDGNVDADPLFITQADPISAPGTGGNFRITYGSPAINSGDDTADLDGPGSGTNTAASIDGDLDGAVRLVGTIDIGAYEFLDSDGDRLSDWQEINIYGSDPNDADSDHDGVDDGDEAYAGTDPTNASSYLALTGAQLTGTNRVIAWSSVSNRAYRLWYSTNLLSGAWNNLGVYTSTPPINMVTNAPAAGTLYYLIGVE